MEDNYYDHDEEDVLHDAFLMIESDSTEYENIEDVLIGETIFEQGSIDFWKENIDSFE